MPSKSYIQKRMAATTNTPFIVQYEASMKWLREFPAAIIFPEEFLSLNCFWMVNVSNSTRRRAVGVNTLPCYAPRVGLRLEKESTISQTIKDPKLMVQYENDDFGVSMLGRDGFWVLELTRSSASNCKPAADTALVGPCRYLPAFKKERLSTRWSDSPKAKGHIYKKKLYDELNACFATEEDALRYMHKILAVFEGGI